MLLGLVSSRHRDGRHRPHARAHRALGRESVGTGCVGRPSRARRRLRVQRRALGDACAYGLRSRPPPTLSPRPLRYDAYTRSRSAVPPPLGWHPRTIGQSRAQGSRHLPQAHQGARREPGPLPHRVLRHASDGRRGAEPSSEHPGEGGAPRRVRAHAKRRQRYKWHGSTQMDVEALTPCAGRSLLSGMAGGGSCWSAPRSPPSYVLHLLVRRAPSSAATASGSNRGRYAAVLREGALRGGQMEGRAVINTIAWPVLGRISALLDIWTRPRGYSRATQYQAWGCVWGVWGAVPAPGSVSVQSVPVPPVRTVARWRVSERPRGPPHTGGRAVEAGALGRRLQVSRRSHIMDTTH